jgi:hypothetical protein
MKHHSFLAVLALPLFAVLTYTPSVAADPASVQLVCDNLGSILLDYANGKVTFQGRIYPMDVTAKEITWQLHSDTAGRNYFYTLDRDTGQLMYRNDGDNTAGVDSCKVGGQKF